MSSHFYEGSLRFSDGGSSDRCAIHGTNACLPNTDQEAAGEAEQSPSKSTHSEKKEKTKQQRKKTTPFPSKKSSNTKLLRWR